MALLILETKKIEDKLSLIRSMIDGTPKGLHAAEIVQLESLRKKGIEVDKDHIVIEESYIADRVLGLNISINRSRKMDHTYNVLVFQAQLEILYEMKRLSYLYKEESVTKSKRLSIQLIEPNEKYDSETNTWSIRDIYDNPFNKMVLCQ